MDLNIIFRTQRPGHQNSEELQKYFRPRKKPKLFIDSSKKEDTVSLIYEHFLDVQADS